MHNCYCPNQGSISDIIEAGSFTVKPGQEYVEKTLHFNAGVNLLYFENSGDHPYMLGNYLVAPAASGTIHIIKEASGPITFTITCSSQNCDGSLIGYTWDRNITMPSGTS